MWLCSLDPFYWAHCTLFLGPLVYSFPTACLELAPWKSLSLTLTLCFRDCHFPIISKSITGLQWLIQKLPDWELFTGKTKSSTHQLYSMLMLSQLSVTGPDVWTINTFFLDRRKPTCLCVCANCVLLCPEMFHYYSFTKYSALKQIYACFRSLLSHSNWTGVTCWAIALMFNQLIISI